MNFQDAFFAGGIWTEGTDERSNDNKHGPLSISRRGCGGSSRNRRVNDRLIAIRYRRCIEGKVKRSHDGKLGRPKRNNLIRDGCQGLREIRFYGGGETCIRVTCRIQIRSTPVWPSVQTDQALKYLNQHIKNIHQGLLKQSAHRYAKCGSKLGLLQILYFMQKYPTRISFLTILRGAVILSSYPIYKENLLIII
jgi:hypothetical protein